MNEAKPPTDKGLAALGPPTKTAFETRDKSEVETCAISGKLMRPRIIIKAIIFFSFEINCLFWLICRRLRIRKNNFGDLRADVCGALFEVKRIGHYNQNNIFVHITPKIGFKDVVDLSVMCD